MTLETNQTDLESTGLVPDMLSWTENKFAEHSNWAIRRYSALLDLPPSVFSTIHPRLTWKNLLEFEAKTDQGLIDFYPLPENRQTLIAGANQNLEWIKRRCFDWDYLLLPSKERKNYPTSQAYWDNREEIITGEFNEFKRHITYSWEEETDAPQFYRAYWSKLIYDYISAHVMNNYTSRLNLASIQEWYKGGFRKYLKEYDLFPGGYLRPIGKKATDELIVHVLDRDTLNLALASGRLGNNGLGRVCFTEDRVSYDFGYALVFSLKELQKVYPIYRIDEDPYDAHLLQEWRSPIAVDINLALACIPTTEQYFGPLPEGQAWGTRVYGQDVINDIKKTLPDASK